MIMPIENQTNFQRIEQVMLFLEKKFKQQPNLDEIANNVALSTFDLQQLFLEWVGISPKKFLQYLTTDFLKAKLKQSKNILDMAELAGLSSQSGTYDRFVAIEAVTPKEYKLQREGIKIDYSFHDTPFGTCLLGLTQRGICWLSFFSKETDQHKELEKMKDHWSRSTFQHDQEMSSSIVNQIFYSNVFSQKKLSLFVKGTNFQIKVWKALLKISIGCLTTYKDVAQQIEQPHASRAVGSAVGANHVAWLIPCHRVIRNNGILGEYRWQTSRKKCIIGWELSKKLNA